MWLERFIRGNGMSGCLESEVVLDGPREIIVDRAESGFDRACDLAYSMAVNRFGIDDCGHSTYTPGWERSCCWIEIVFDKYVRIGNSHVYSFVAYAKKNVQD